MISPDTKRCVMRWEPSWRLWRWRVYLHEWRHDVLDRCGATTGRVIELTPPRWLWIKLLAHLAGSRFERVRALAMKRWRVIAVTYWNSLCSEDDERGALPHVSRVD